MPSTLAEFNPVPAPARDAAPALPTFHACILYEDVPAGRRAMAVVDRLARQAGGSTFQPALWRFDLLEFSDCFQSAIEDADRSDLLIVATRSSDHLRPIVQDWIQTHINRRAGRGIAIVSLFGEREGWSIALHDRLEAFRRPVPPVPDAALLHEVLPRIAV